MQVRALTTDEECRRVAALSRDIPDGESIPAAVLGVAIKRGGILLGAFDDADTLIGFVCSTPGVKDRQLTQWSHPLGVTPEARGTGVGTGLRLGQRTAALAMGIALIEWTFDPLQAVDAHVNFAKLGTIVHEYEADVYGDSVRLLHQAAPADRFVAEWHLRLPHVERRIAASGLTVRDGSLAAAPVVNPSRGDAPDGLIPGPPDLSVDARRLLVEIPSTFQEMQRHDPSRALAWRLHTREIFETILRRGYRVVDFFHAPSAGRGHYLLARPDGT